MPGVGQTEDSTQDSTGHVMRRWLRRGIRFWSGDAREEESPRLAATLRKVVHCFSGWEEW